MTTATADIGLIGLGVMGQNLVLNFSDHGFTVVVYNRWPEVTAEFLAGPAANRAILGATDLAEFTAQLKRPRQLLIMVTAGDPVDWVIESLLPHLEVGDIILDGGNSHYTDTIRRTRYLAEKGILFVGAGISGGEEGARHGPSIMPGGAIAAWPHVRHPLQTIAAKTADGTPCCDWVGEDGAGHFVKMVHNGIEYGDMQLIAEVYDVMQRVLGLTPAEMSAVFHRWNAGKLNSYLIEITAHILASKDATERPLLDTILDAAGQKGTGKWTANAALDFGVPLTLIGEAVFARALSAHKETREMAAPLLAGPAQSFTGDREAVLADLEEALYAAKIVSYAQGYWLFHTAAAAQNWQLNYGGIALMWREGCIIRAAFLDKIKEAYDQNPALTHLLLAPYFQQQMAVAQTGWRRVVSLAVLQGVPTPALSSALAFYDGFRSGRLPANLIQAQRDYFGAHTYERVDYPRGAYFHTDWLSSDYATEMVRAPQTTPPGAKP